MRYGGIDMSEEMINVYQTWINSLASANTIHKYTSSVTLFSNMVFKKKPTEISEFDLVHLRYSDVLNKFVTPLKENDIKGSTIKGHLIAVRSLMKMIKKEGIYDKANIDDLNNYVLTDKTLKTNDVKHHEAISLEELDQFKDFLTKRKYRDDQDGMMGKKYAELVDFMFKTGIRVTATFSIKWIDFQFIVAHDGTRFARLDVIDKGHKLNTKYLTLSYYQNLHDLLFTGSDEEFVFGELSHESIKNAFRDFSKKINHKLSPHSLRAGAATTLYYQTKDIMLVKDFLDHESVANTEKYIHNQTDPTMTGTAMLTSDYDYSEIDNLSKEQLLMLIHSRPEIENVVYRAGKDHKVLK